MAVDKGPSRGGKRKFDNARQQFGSRNKKKELGRGAWSRQKGDKRARNEEQAAKRQRLDEEGNAKPSVLPGPFPQEDIDKEERRPKHKVAVLIGYSGTGYRGMQISTTERTIEGDLFTAFVHSGAISKANANDPKKSGLVRCARTDKGVHAMGNVVSLKLIVEDEDIVQRINSHLSEQIRVWGITRTVGSFSCYQSCDSRWYEYLMPSHAFLPPHPNSFLGLQLIELAEEIGDLEGLRQRQQDASHFWDDTEEAFIKPIIDKLESPLKELVVKALYEAESNSDAPSGETVSPEGQVLPAQSEVETDPEIHTKSGLVTDKLAVPNPVSTLANVQESKKETATSEDAEIIDPLTHISPDLRKEIELTTKKIRQTYLQAKRLYRISPQRMDRVRKSLTKFLGTQNFHNYTIQKAPRDPSAKRLIKSFELDPQPKIINGTEWLSLKIHGQSFMMHQIRKMVSALTLVVRTGCPLERITETLRDDVSISIPKVPGLGLLLERPVFQSYNDNTAAKYEKDSIEFTKHEKEMEEFKQREIYQRIFREEEEGHAFFTFFGHVDGFKENAFLWVTSKGIEATKRGKKEHGPKGTSGTGRNGSREHRSEPPLGDIDSGDEEDVEETGRADMDG